MCLKFEYIHPKNLLDCFKDMDFKKAKKEGTKVQ